MQKLIRKPSAPAYGLHHLEERPKELQRLLPMQKLLHARACADPAAKLFRVNRFGND